MSAPRLPPPPPPPKPNTPPKYTQDDNTTAAPPPLPATPFVPEQLRDKSREDLQYLLHSPPLLSALFHSSHPHGLGCAAALTSILSANIALATNLQSLESSLIVSREATQQRLLETKALEKRWREKEKEMYQALQPFSSVAQYARLQTAVAESERVSGEMEERFLDGDGEVETWVKAYREVRRVEALRRERGARWGEGRVGGWRN